jgi:hypothetical protein
MDHIDRLLQIAKEREQAEAAKPLEQRKREYREEHEAKWLATEEGRLCKEFARAFQAYKDYLAQRMRDWRPGNGEDRDFDEHQLFEEMIRRSIKVKRECEESDRRNLERADWRRDANIAGPTALTAGRPA